LLAAWACSHTVRAESSYHLGENILENSQVSKIRIIRSNLCMMTKVGSFDGFSHSLHNLLWSFVSIDEFDKLGEQACPVRYVVIYEWLHLSNQQDLEGSQQVRPRRDSRQVSIKRVYRGCRSSYVRFSLIDVESEIVGIYRLVDPDLVVATEP